MICLPRNLAILDSPRSRSCGSTRLPSANGGAPASCNRKRFAPFFTAAIFSCRQLMLSVPLVLCGCEVFSSSALKEAALVKDAGRRASELKRPSPTIFEAVEVDLRITEIVERHNQTIHWAGIRDAALLVPRLGTGDELSVEIFEASSHGLFSSGRKKSISFDVEVSDKGTIDVPYAGAVVVANSTPEEARQAVRRALVNKAVDPDVVLGIRQVRSRPITVAGDVAHSGVLQLPMIPERLTQTLARAGGSQHAPFQSTITLVRGKTVVAMSLQSIIETPSQNLHLIPNDKIFVSFRQGSFIAMGAARADRYQLPARDVSLLEAIALASGSSDKLSTAKAFFLFRLEDETTVEAIIGKPKFSSLRSIGYSPNSEGRYPFVYIFHAGSAGNLFVGQRFKVVNGDVLYFSGHPDQDNGGLGVIFAQSLTLASKAASVSD